MNLKGTRVLVTGGTGFIGGRLVERLVMEYGADVRVLVKNFARAARIARFPIEMLPGDVTEPAAVERAVDGCEIVFHCAYGNTGSPAQQKGVTVQGTGNILQAALKHKAKRVVHVSTISVYGKTGDGDLDESAPRRRSNDVYADSKLEAEKLVFKYFNKYGLPVAVIQPTIVYGPFGGSWTLNPINQLKSGRVILAEGGNGLCNAVYVDDVIQAMILAATRDEAVGEAFLISAEEPVTWREFYGAYERMLGFESTISMSLREVEELNKRYKKAQSTIGQVMTALREHPYILSRILQLPAVSRAYRVASVLTPDSLQNRLKNFLMAPSVSTRHHPLSSPEKPILPLTKARVDFFRVHTCVRIDKAKRLLGYEPSFDFEQGMRLTEMWVRYSNLV
ncbi:GDP-L-fucose synthase [subsurface metagenome]